MKVLSRARPKKPEEKMIGLTWIGGAQRSEIG